MKETKKKNISIKNCKECGNEFESLTYKMRAFCSHRCANKATNRKNRAIKSVIKCLNCDKYFARRPGDIKRNRVYSKGRLRYCSPGCFHQKQQTVSSLKKVVWTNFSKYIKERDNWTCFTCDKYIKGAQMHGGHYISRRYNATLFDERNVHAQCSSCNMFKNGEPHIYTQKLLKIHGYEWLEKLIEDSKIPKKFTKAELLELKEVYAKKIQ